jgi:DNA polymerase alpha subunit A
MKAKGSAVRAHDVIPYIMCLGADGKSAKSAQADKAFHPDDLRRQGSELRIGESIAVVIRPRTVLISRLRLLP